MGPGRPAEYTPSGSVTWVRGLRGGRLRALAVTTPQRSSTVPDVPAMAETIPGFETYSWQALVGLPLDLAAGPQQLDTLDELAGGGHL